MAQDTGTAAVAEPQGYNGWKNYETWAVNLWMSNDQGSDEMFREMAADAWEAALNRPADSVFTRSEYARLTLADAFKSHHEDAMPELEGVWADLLGAALSEVDWHEIADADLAEMGGYEPR